MCNRRGTPEIVPQCRTASHPGTVFRVVVAWDVGCLVWSGWVGFVCGILLYQGFWKMTFIIPAVYRMAFYDSPGLRFAGWVTLRVVAADVEVASVLQGRIDGSPYPLLLNPRKNEAVRCC